MLDMFRCRCGVLVLKDWWWIVGGWLVKEDIERVVMCDKCRYVFERCGEYIRLKR